MKAARLWPLAMVAVLAATVAGNVALYLAANDRAAAVAEPDYYRKAVAWDTTLAEERRSQALGWTLSARIVPGPDSLSTVEIALVDRSGVAVDSADVAVTAIHDFAPARTVEGRARAGRDGVALVRLPLRRSGLWELRVRAQRAGHVFVATLKCEARGVMP